MFSPLFVRLVPSAAILFTRASFSCFPQHSPRFVVFSRSPCSSAVMSQKFVSILTLTEQQIADADQLEPSFEHLLRDAKVDNGTILALRHCEISDRETFVGLDDSAEGLKSLAKDMGIDLESGGMPHKREFSRLSTAWKKAKAQLEVKTTTEALQRQHGEPVTMLPEDWTSVVVQFKKKFGSDLQDEELPSQFYYEEFQERLSAGMLRAEPLEQVISMAEAEQQDSQRPDPPRQYGIHLNAQLTLQTRKRYSSVAPKNFEELRLKYEVMGNMWLLAQLRQPGRSVFADLEPNTFQKFLKQLLGKQDFNLQKEIHGKFLSAPNWEHCLSYELELRREAYKQCRESNVGIKAAWWEAYHNQQHRMMHWLQLVSLANSHSASSSSSDLSKVQKELADLRNEVRNRSRTPNPRGKGKGGRGAMALQAPAQLALPPPAQAQPKARGRGRKGGGGKGGKGD